MFTDRTNQAHKKRIIDEATVQRLGPGDPKHAASNRMPAIKPERSHEARNNQDGMQSRWSRSINVAGWREFLEPDSEIKSEV